jgi:hypothetical protein
LSFSTNQACFGHCIFCSQFNCLFVPAPILGSSRRNYPKNQQVAIIIHTTRGRPRPCFDLGFGFFTSFLYYFFLILFGRWYNSHTPRTTDCVHYFMGFMGHETSHMGIWIMDLGGDMTRVLDLDFVYLELICASLLVSALGSSLLLLICLYRCNALPFLLTYSPPQSEFVLITAIFFPLLPTVIPLYFLLSFKVTFFPYTFSIVSCSHS